VLVNKRTVAGLAGLALAGGACLAMATGGSVAHAATVKCGDRCVSLFNDKFGSADVSAVTGGVGTTGQSVTLTKAAAVPAQDFALFDLGTVRSFYRAHLVNGTLNASYGWDQVYEYEYVPARSFTDRCLGVTPGTTTVSLQPCGHTDTTLWIADEAASNGSYTPLISGTDTAAPAAEVLTAAKVGATFTLTPLSKKGVPAADQQWQEIDGVIPGSGTTTP
jgi:hypothetical protein